MSGVVPRASPPPTVPSGGVPSQRMSYDAVSALVKASSLDSLAPTTSNEENIEDVGAGNDLDKRKEAEEQPSPSPAPAQAVLDYSSSTDKSVKTIPPLSPVGNTSREGKEALLSKPKVSFSFLFQSYLFSW